MRFSLERTGIRYNGVKFYLDCFQGTKFYSVNGIMGFVIMGLFLKEKSLEKFGTGKCFRYNGSFVILGFVIMGFHCSER